MHAKAFWMVALAAFVYAPEAGAIVMVCPDGTPVSLTTGPNPCWGHFGPPAGGSNNEDLPYCDSLPATQGSWGVADPIVATVHEATRCRARVNGDDQHGGSQVVPALRDADVMVDYSFRSEPDCVASLSGRTASAGGSAHLPSGETNLQKYCHKLFGDEGSGARHATLNVTFVLRKEHCEEQLTTRIHEAGGTPRLSGPADSFCKDLFEGSGNPSKPSGGGGGGGGEGTGGIDTSDL